MSKFSREVTQERFEQDVVEASRKVPVIVDFWATWCAPCRALTPILERLAEEYKGEFLLAKLDTDKNPEIAARFGIRSIPNVKAFVNGMVAGEFLGAIPEPAVRAFLSKVIPSPAEKLRSSAGDAVREGDFEVAEARLREALKLEPENPAVRLDLVELLLARQAFSEADLEMQKVPDRSRDERAEQLASQIAFWKKGQSLPPVAELEAALEKAPDDLDLRLHLAERCIADGSYEPALEQLLEVVRRDRGTFRDRARKTMVEVFSLAGDQAELVTRYRRLLSNTLYS